MNQPASSATKSAGGQANRRATEKDGIPVPLVSVITIVYNEIDCIEDTILSITGQDYENLEYIIVDGGSTDGTVDIVRKYDHLIDYWVSEKDRGIYDAMNKGIDLAHGKWLNFMNGGDRFVDDNVITNVFGRTLSADTQIIYGNHIVDYGEFSVKKISGEIKNLWKKTQFCHQSAFISMGLHKTLRYNFENKICGDFEFFYTAYKLDVAFEKLNQEICLFSVGGVSDTQRLASIYARLKVVYRHPKDFGVVIYYLYLMMNNFLRQCIKQILPRKWVRQIQRRR